MKSLKNPFGNAGQSSSEVKKPQKHDANLQKNTTLYFQIGLILCLLGTFALMEMQFETKYLPEINDEIEYAEDITLVFHDFRIEKPQVEAPKERQQKVIDIIEQVPDNYPDVIQNVITPEDPNFDPPVDPGSVKDPIEEDPEIDIPFVAVQHVPVFPGCEKFTDNEDRKTCMSEKITKLVQKRFDTGIASDYGLSGIQKIQVQFIVDKEGMVTGIKTRAPHPKLEEEAVRVVNKIPQMKPGMQQAKPVNVIYTLPITFMVRD